MGEDKGHISEWNEGSTRIERIHIALTNINMYKTNPTLKFNGRFNYENWFLEIGVLYGEGTSKYSSDEIKEVDRLKSIIGNIIKYNSPIKSVTLSSFGNNTTWSAWIYCLSDELLESGCSNNC
ncbi:MAG: hypothetical protein WCJ18_08200, partial [Planctomycetota bacterium]